MRKVFIAGVMAAIAIAAACTDNGSSTTGIGTNDGGRVDGGDTPEPVSPPGDDDSGPPVDGGDAGPSTCALTKSYEVACGHQLTCGDAHFDEWCAKNDEQNDSLAFRRGEAKCLVAPANCDPDKRKDCDYKSYGTATPTTSQTQLVAAYCSTCEPGDATCAARATTYDVDAGPNGVTDVFVAAWELSDALTDLIRTQCTGSAFDAGADCKKAFGNCAGGVYIDHLPDCPQ